MLPAMIWPRTPAPSGPVRSLIFRMPAARMTGVDSRNENRIASSWFSPRVRPPTMVTPSRLMPANRARICDAPIHSAFQIPMPASRCSAASSSITSRSLARSRP